jgi:hypothetical protein
VDGVEKHHHDTKNRIVDCGFVGFFMPWLSLIALIGALVIVF